MPTMDNGWIAELDSAGIGVSLSGSHCYLLCASRSQVLCRFLIVIPLAMYISIWIPLACNLSI